jgi:hypothetical protein
MSRRAITQLSVLAVSLASACSSSPPRGTQTQQVRSGNQIGDGSSSPAADPGALAPTRRADVARSQTDVDNAMRKLGYTPASYRGERVYCRSEMLTGSNLASRLCLTAQQIEDQERAGKDIVSGNHQAGCSAKIPCP